MLYAMQPYSRYQATQEIFAALKANCVMGGPHGTIDSVLASHPAAPGSILGVPKKISSFDVAEIY